MSGNLDEFGVSLARQRLLDSACAPLRVKLFRTGGQELGEASMQLTQLIHDTANLEVDLELHWSEADVRSGLCGPGCGEDGPMWLDEDDLL